MKNRVLSVLLSIGIILSNFSTGFTVIAEDGIGATDPSNSTTENTEQEEQTDEGTNIEPNEEQNDETVDVKVVLNDNFPASVFYGQDLPFDSNGLINSDFYYFVNSETTEMVMSSALNESVILTASLNDGEMGCNETASYVISMTSESNLINDGSITYAVTFEPTEFYVYGNYTPEPAKVTYDSRDYKKVVFSVAEGYAISDSSDTDADWTSNEYSIDLESVQNGEFTYYVRNIRKDDEAYGAIAEFVHTFNAEASLENYAKIVNPNSSLDIIGGYYNSSLTFEVSYSVTEAANVSLVVYNNGTAITSEGTSISETVNGATIFTNEYTITLESKSSLNVNLTADLLVNGVKQNLTDNRLYLWHNNQYFQDYNFILENIKPNINIDEVYNQNLAQIHISDSESGLSKVEYSLDDGKTWVEPQQGSIRRPFNTYTNDTFESGKNYYMFYVDTAKSGSYKSISLKVRAWDRAGNCTDDEEAEIENDGSEAEITKIEILDEQFNPYELKSYEYGNFANQTVILKVIASDPGHEDEANHGISGVWICDGETVLSKYEVKEVKESDDETGEESIDYWYFELSPNVDINNLLIYVSDGRWSTSVSINDNKFLNVDSARLVIENDAPSGDIEKTNFSNYVNETNWYGLSAENGEIKVTVYDDMSGIASVVIKDGTTILNGNDTDFTKNDEALNTKEYSFLVNSFKDGEHTLSVLVTDNCGNTNSKDITLSFNTDFNRPTGTINFVTGVEGVAEPKKIEIDGEIQNWFNGCDAEAETVVFTLEISDEHPYKVMYSFVNSESQKVYESERLYIKDDGTSVYAVEINDTDAKIELEQKHYLDVYVTFVDQAGNTSTYDDETGHHEIAPIRFYKDFKYPEIHTVTVSKTETGFDKVLRVLTFGIYSNNNIKYTVNASDISDDSGLADASVLISFGDSSYVMTRENDTTYSYVIDASDEMVLSGEIMVSVTDRYGLETNRTVHYSEDFDVINGTAEEPFFTIGKDQTSSKDFMIDKNRPTVEFEPLISDGQERTDNTIWFKDDHDIKFTVNDADSGISSIIVTVNADKDHPLTADSDGIHFLTEEMTSNYSTIDEVKKTVSYRLSTDSLMNLIQAEDGHYVIEVVVTDYAGNVNETSVIDYYIDKVSPEVNSIDFSIPSADNYTDAADFIDILEYGFYFKTDLIATVNITDKEPSSGLYNIEYNLIEYNNGVKGAENPGTARIENGKASFSIPANFKGQIFVKGYDYVGNVSDEVTPQSFVVDTPERHDSEEHIEITGLDATGHTDSERHPLYDTNVNLTVRISDTTSGIRDISYSISSEQDTQDIRTITINNTGNTVGQNLGDDWTITAMDENLVTEVTRSYSFSADNNNIQLSFAMTDRANNTSEKISDIFSIDQTAPIINVVFDSPSGNNEYYRENRTATITVIERNFDASRITASITNEIGNVPGLSFTSNSNTEHVATLVFGEGDYTFGIEGTDRCNHTATVNYSGGNERSFHVDMTDPTEIDNFDQFINDLENSFNVDKEMTFTITEHNFVPSLVNIKVYRTKAGQELTTENREDCTSKYISPGNWTSVGDTHTLSFKFTEDYVYQVVISATDASGRSLAEKASPVFEIDKTVPVLKTPANLDVLVFTSKNTETSATPLEFFDDNIASIHYSVVSYQMKLNEDNVGYDMDVDSEEFDVKSDSVVISDEFFNQDGIYEVKCIAYDIAGNSSEESTHTFVIQRDTDFLVYIPNSNKDKHTGLYKFDKTGIRSADFDDIEIITYITKDKNFEVQVDGAEVTDADLDVKKDDRRINQVDMYDAILKNSYIAQNYNADTIDTDLTLNAVATDGDTDQIITLGHIYIDNVKPVGEYESALQNLGTFDGFYGVESRTVMIEGVSSDIDLNRCEIQTNDTVLRYDDGGFNYDADAHTISFTIEKGYTDIRPTLVDNAGNINNLSIIKKVYVGGLFARWWYLFIFGSLIVLAIPTFIIVTFVRRKRNIH